jgi:hypothetical protein
MTNLKIADTEAPLARNSFRIVARGPRISPREAYAADHVIVDRQNVYRRRIETCVIPRIDVHGARR